MQYIVAIILIPFLYINYKIIASDIKEKIIPNTYLKYLLLFIPFFYLYAFLFFEINYYLFILQIIVTIGIGFSLYYFGLWGAGDAKYLIVLGIFIPQIGIITFIGNIALITLGYLLAYFVWFYFGKCLFSWKYAVSLYDKIYTDLRDKFLIFIKHADGNIYRNQAIKILLNWCINFLILFVGFRLFRLLIIGDYATDKDSLPKFGSFLIQYPIYLTGITIIIIWILKHFWKRSLVKIKNYVEKILGIRYDKTSLLLPLFFFSILIIFIIFEYLQNPYKLSSYLYRIFTFYIILYIILRILLYSYKITFQVSETHFINIQDLKEGEIVDKEYLIGIFGEQSCLVETGDTGILGKNPKVFLQEMENPIDKESAEKIIEMYRMVSDFHKLEGTSNYEEISKIKILMTFALSPYIFLGFIFSYFLGKEMYVFILSNILNFIKLFYSHN